MLDYQAFSALRLDRVFPQSFLQEYPRYFSHDPDGSYFIEYLGDSWDVENIDGVEFWYPASDGKNLGVVQLWASHLVALDRRYRDAPDSNTTSLVSAWKANADRVLEALDLPWRMGIAPDAVQSASGAEVQDTLFPGTVWASPYAADFRDSFKTIWVLVGAPGLYHVAATFHEKDGLVHLEIRRADIEPDLGDEDEFAEEEYFT